MYDGEGFNAFILIPFSSNPNLTLLTPYYYYYYPLAQLPYQTHLTALLSSPLLSSPLLPSPPLPSPLHSVGPIVPLANHLGPHWRFPP